MVLNAEQMLYARCPTCSLFLNWFHTMNNVAMVATCCGTVFEAGPVSSRWLVRVWAAKLENVIVFPRLATGDPNT